MSFSYQCKTQDRAHFRKTFIITASSLHRQEQSLHLTSPDQALCTVLIPAESAEKESCKRSWDAPGMRDLLTFTASQTGSQQAPASGTARCRTTASALQALLLSLAGTDSKHAGPLSVLLGWMSRGRDAVPSYPTLRCNQSSEGGEKLSSALPSRGKNFLGCSSLGGCRREQAPESVSRLSPSERLDSGKALCPQEAPQAKAPAPLQPLETPPCAAPLPLPGHAARCQPASPRRRGSGRGHRADRQPVRATAAGAFRAGAGRSEELRPRGRRRPGGCRNPQTAGGEGRAERRGQRLSLAPEGHRPHSSPHPALNL